MTTNRRGGGWRTEEPLEGAASINPHMVTLARESRGFTQTELARRLGVTQGWLSKVENGLLGIADEALEKLAGGLGYPPSFFYQRDPVYGMGTVELFHRKRQSVSDRVLDTIHARINVMRMHIARLLKGVDIGECDFPYLDVDEYGSPAEVARVLRAHWKIPKGPIQDLVQVIEDAGGIVVSFDFGGAKVDAVSTWPPGLPPLFFVNSEAPGDRLRFSLAHELAHIVMHSRPSSRDIEKEADTMASEFLMPEKDIKPYLYPVTLPRLAALKPVWKVSMSALAVRADHLGLLPERQKRALWVQLGPMRLKEPAELDIPVEKPYLLEDIIKTYRTDLGYSVADLAAMLHFREEDVRALYIQADRPNLRVVRR